MTPVSRRAGAELQAHEDIAARRQELVGARTQKQYNEQYEVRAPIAP